MDCGPTCLHMVSKYYSRSFSIEKLRDLTEIGKEGVNILGISNAAEKIAYRTQAVQLNIIELKEAKLPCILHWQQNHFVVLYKIKRNQFYIADPAKGLIKLPQKEFEQRWLTSKTYNEATGILLLLEPTPAFSSNTYDDDFTEIKTKSFGSIVHYLFPYKLKKKKMLHGDMIYLQQQHGNLLKQKNIQQEDVDLAKETFDANKALKEDKVISPLDYRNEKSKYLGKALSIPQISSAIISNESNQHEKQKEILQLENEIAQQKGVFSQSINTLKAQVDEWKNKYLLTAPVDGKISFASFLQENQQLQNNQTVCYINPENTQYYAEVYIPQNNFGKVKQGQKVLLKLPAYPFQEFRAISGKLDFISAIATDTGYLAKVLLPNGLLTNYKKQIQYHEGLSAHVEIITEDLKLSDRNLNQLRSVIKNH